MMNKNKIKYILFIFWLICFVGMAPSFALAVENSDSATCTEEQVEKIEKNLNQAALEGLKNSKALLDNYNKIAEQYISGCNKNVNKGTPVFWSMDAYQSAYTKDPGLADSLMKDRSQYQYTGIVWSGEAPISENCKNLRNNATAALDAFNRSRITTSNMLGRAGGRKVPKTCICSENADEQECVSYANEDNEQQATKDGCPTFNEYLADLTSCPLCVIFEVILNTDSAVAHIAWEKLSKPLQGVVSIFFLVFLALETLKVVANMAGSGTSAYLKTIIILGFKVAIVLILLQDSTYVYGYFISPVLKGGLEMGQEFLRAGAKDAGACQMTGTTSFGSIQGNELDSSILSSILETIRCFSNSSLIMPSIGRALMCHGWENEGSFLGIPDFEMWFAGIITYIFGLMIWLSVTFYLIDCTVQLGMVCGLVPLFIACWPFKMTQRYTTTGVKMILNTFFTFVLMGIVMLVGMEIISFAISGGSNQSDVASKIAILNSSNFNMDRLKKMVSLDSEAILILIACCIMAMKLLGVVNSAAGKFSSGSGMSIGSKMGGTAGTVAKNITLATAAATWIGGKGALRGAGNYLANNTDVGRGVANGYNRLKTSIRNFRSTINRELSEDAPAALGAAMGLERFQPERQTEMPTNEQATRQPNTPNTPETPNNNNHSNPNNAENKLNPEHQKLIDAARQKFDNSDKGKKLQNNIDKAKENYLKAVEEHGKNSVEAKDARDKLRDAVDERRDAKHDAVGSYLSENAQSSGAHGTYLKQMNLDNQAQHDRIAQAKQEVENDTYMKNIDKQIADTENWNNTLERAHQINPQLAQAIEQSTGGAIGPLPQEEITRRTDAMKQAKDVHMLHEMQNKLSGADFERFLTSYQQGETF